MLRSAVNGVYVYDLALQRNVFVSPRYTELTGYTLDEINSKKDGEFLALFHPDDLDQVLAHMGEVAAADDGVRVPLEYRFRRKDGEWIWLFGHDVPYERAPDGTLTRFMGSFVDISAQKRIQDDLSHFAHVAAHDLREPAQRIMMSSDLVLDMARDQLDEGSLDLLQSLNDQAERLLALVGDLRALTGLTTNSLARETVDVGALVRSVVDELAETIEARGATVEIDALPSVSTTPALLRSVFVNLARNALQYGGAGTRIRFTAERHEGEPCFGVWNSGTPIEADRREAIFLPFRRFATGGSGSGLGLAICRRIVTGLGGRIWAESGADWSHVRFTLEVE